jgi:hypothetical protein
MTATTTEDATMAQSYAGTKLHAMRISDEIWAAAIARSAADGSSVTAEVVAFLKAYGAGERYVLRAAEPAPAKRAPRKATR